MKRVLFYVVVISMTLYAWADDAYMGRIRYDGMNYLHQIIGTYQLEDSVVCYPHIGFFTGATWLFIVKKSDTSVVNYVGSCIVKNGDTTSYKRYESIDTDSIDAIFSLLDSTGIQVKYDSIYNPFYSYFYVCNPTKCNIFEWNTCMKKLDPSHKELSLSKGLLYMNNLGIRYLQERDMDR